MQVGGRTFSFGKKGFKKGAQLIEIESITKSTASTYDTDPWTSRKKYHFLESAHWMGSTGTEEQLVS